MGISPTVIRLISSPLVVVKSLFFSVALKKPLPDSSRRSLRSFIAAVARVGSAVLTDSVIVICGFGLLCFSTVPANARLGTLLAASLATTLLANVLAIPVMYWTLSRRSGRSRRP